MKQEDNTKEEIGNDESKDTGETTLSSDSEEDDLDYQK